MPGTWEVPLRDEVATTDQVQKDPRLHEIQLQDVLAVADQLHDPGELLVSGIDPPRGRAGDTVTINGIGFSPTPSQNRVTFSGFVATVTAASPTQLQATVPIIASILDDAWLVVVVNRPPFGPRTAAWLFRSLPAIATLADLEIPGEIPGPGELENQEDPRVPEAKDHARLLTLAEFLLRDLALLSHDGTGLAEPTRRNFLDVKGPPYGETLLCDPAQASGLAWGWAQESTLAYGGTILPAQATSRLTANGDQGQATAHTGPTQQSSLADAKLFQVWFLVKRDVGPDTVDRVAILVNGGTAWDSGTGLGLGADAVYAQDLGLDVEAEDTLEVWVARTGSSSTFRLAGGLRLGVR